MTLEAEGLTSAEQPHAEAAALRQVKIELSEKIERECAHVDAVLSERIDGVRELLDQRINDQTRLFRAEFNGLEAKLAHETRTIRKELVHETGTLRAGIAGLKDQIDTRLAHDFGAVDAEFEAVGKKFEAVHKEFAAVRKEIADLKDLLLGRMEQQERVRAAEYAATKWSIRSMMAAMALLVAMMARFTLFQ